MLQTMPKRKPTGATAAPQDEPVPAASTPDSPDKKSKSKRTRKREKRDGNSVPEVSTRVTRSRSKQENAVQRTTAAPPERVSATTVTTQQDDDSCEMEVKSQITESMTSSRYFEMDGAAGSSGLNGWQATELGDESDDSDGCGDDWEEVADAVISTDDEEQLNHHHPSLPAEGIAVELEHPRTRKRKQEKADLERKRVNRNKKLLQEMLHKSHFLCLFARGFYLNAITFDQTVQAISLSHISFLCRKSAHKSPHVTRQFFVDLMQNFSDYFDLKRESSSPDQRQCLDRLITCLSTRTAKDALEYVMAFISLLRAIKTFQCLEYSVRVCLPIRPMPIKAGGLIPSEKQETARPEEESKGKSRRKNKRGMLSSDDDDDVIVEPKKVTKKRTSAPTSTLQRPPVWGEVYLASEGQWVCVEVLNGLLDEPLQIEKTFEAEETFNYVIAYDDDGIVKEVSCRYAEKALTASFNRQRVEKEWLEGTISSFKPIMKSARERDEDKQMSAILASRPMPKTISEFKSHPLYVLKRHLLVYEAIHPPDTRPVDHFREEPVYSRSCVKPIRSKQYWQRKARVLKEDAYPYKVVKGRKKWDKYAEKYMTDIPKELFGFWQTEPYQPPVASGGKVPRNEFGNVELFQPCMLPIGTVHLRLPALTRLANKLGIDCVPAVVGFDNAKCGVIPVMDGFVVCEEFRETLLAAFAEEQAIARQKREAKRLQRVFANWRRMTRALLIRERLKRKYAD